MNLTLFSVFLMTEDAVSKLSLWEVASLKFNSAFIESCMDVMFILQNKIRELLKSKNQKYLNLLATILWGNSGCYFFPQYK